MLDAMSRGFVSITAVGLVLALAPAALADKRIEAASPNTYTTTNVTMDQGERLTFLNRDFARHDVVSLKAGSDSKPLFRTPLIGQNEEVFVDGSQYLTTGSYQFICSVHSNMQGTLNVTANGTPAQRPGTGGGGTTDTTKPKLSVSIKQATRSSMRLTVSVDEAATTTLRLRRGSRVIASRTIKADAATKRTVRLRYRVPRGSKVTLTAAAKDSAGNKTTLRRSRRV